MIEVFPVRATPWPATARRRARRAQRCRAHARPASPPPATWQAEADELKTADCAAAWDPEGLVPTAIKMLKSKWPELVIVTDVALDPYAAVLRFRPPHATQVCCATNGD